jgi:hypothetical protein
MGEADGSLSRPSCLGGGLSFPPLLFGDDVPFWQAVGCEWDVTNPIDGTKELSAIHFMTSKWLKKRCEKNLKGHVMKRRGERNFGECVTPESRL